MGIANFLASIFSTIVGAIQNDRTRAANEALNDKQIALSEKQMEVSKPVNQVRDLVAAGMTQEQARNIVASRGGATSYAAPTLTSTESGVDMSGVLNGISGIGSGLSQIGQFALSDRAQDNGGVVGSYLAEKSVATLTDHLGELPSEATTLSGFLNYASKDNAPTWAKDLIKSDDWRKCVRNIQGNKALRSFFLDSSSISNTGLNLAGKILQNKRECLEVNLKDIEYTVAQYESQLAILQAECDLETVPLLRDQTIAQINLQLKKFSADDELWSDPAYRNAYIASMLTNQEQQVVMATCLKAIYDGQASWLSKKDNAQLVGIFSALNTCGVTRTDVGMIFAAAEASGINIIPSIKKIFAPATDAANALVDAGAEIVGAASDVVVAGVETAGKLGTAAGDAMNTTREAARNTVSDQALYQFAKDAWHGYSNFYNKVEDRVFRAVVKGDL